MKNILLSAGLSFLFFACSCKKQHSLVKESKTVQYDIGFPVRLLKHFTSKGKEYLAFCDFQTHKKIAVCSIDGHHLFDVPFGNTIEKHIPEGVYGFDPISIDTFALLSKYTNGIYLIDKKGKLIYQKNYSKYMLQGIELWRPFRLKNGNLIAGIQYRGGIDTLNREQTESEKKEYAHNNLYYSQLFIDSSFYLQNYEHVTVQLDSIKSRYATEKDVLGFVDYLVTNNKVYHFSEYSDSIYVFDLTYELNLVKKIHSKYYKIDCKPVKEEDYQKKMTLNIENVWSHSFIQSIVYDESKKVFYCIIRGPGDYAARYMPFSIIVMDENLNSLYEQKFDGNSYNPFIFVGKKGLYINKIDKKNIQQMKFDIFNYE